MTFEELHSLVLQWAKDRSILEHSDEHKQLDKLDEEFKELKSALAVNARWDAIDAIGDMMVVLTLIAKFISSDLFTCYAEAYLQIKNRKGKMVDGIFVKD